MDSRLTPSPIPPGQVAKLVRRKAGSMVGQSASRKVEEVVRTVSTTQCVARLYGL